MKIYNSLDEFARPENGVIATIGNFDGVHLGHQSLMEKTCQLANEHNLPSVGITFNPAPLRLLRPDIAPEILTPIEVRIELLRAAGLQHLIIIKTTQDLLELSSREFATQILVEKLNVKHVVEGYDFRFGRKSDPEHASLEILAKELGFEAHILPAKSIHFVPHDHPVTLSSTFVRNTLKNSDFKIAQQCLGRDYTLVGQVVSGRGQGLSLGFPTANLKLLQQHQLVPEDGVFAGEVRLGATVKQAWHSNEVHPAAVSIGKCETFVDGYWQIEAFLLDYPTDGPALGGKFMTLSFVKRTRGQKKFASIEHLINAIKNDCKEIQQILKDRTA